MNSRYLSQIAFLLILFSGGANGLTLPELKASYEARCLRLVDERVAQIAVVNGGYLKRLDQITKTFQQKGDLKIINQVQAEKSSIERNDWPLAPLSKEAPKALRDARKLYLESAREIHGKSASGIVVATSKMLEILAERQISETKAGRIDEANAIAATKKQFAESESFLAAQEIVALFGGRSTPAFQVRRESDGIEVLIFYDDAGKISEKSPVKNTREASGVAKELGDTKARTFGEFMGLDGGKADPLIYYHNTFDDKESKGVRWTGLKLKTGEDDEVGSYLKLTIDHTVNVMGTIDNCLPIRGSYRISGQFMLDTPAKAYNGIILHHGQGKRISKDIITAKRERVWENFTIESKALSPTGRMMIYFSRDSEKTPQQALGDSLLLSDLKVEILDRRSFFVRKFSSDGSIEKSDEEPSKQALFFEDGHVKSHLEHGD